MQDFRKLEIYRKSMEYGVRIYQFSSRLPTDEKYGLVSQIRRAVTSIALNISEGAGCHSNREFANFVSYAYRSCNEVLTCLELATKLGLVNANGEVSELETEGGRLSRMIYMFLKKLGGPTYNLLPKT